MCTWAYTTITIEIHHSLPQELSVYKSVCHEEGAFYTHHGHYDSVFYV